MGVLAAVQQGRWPDHIVRVVGLIGYSAPIFWLDMIALLIFYAKLDWVAGPGRLDVYYDGIVEPASGILLIDAAMAGEWEIFDNALAHLILPASILGTFALAYISRMTRSFMLDQLSQEYILTARVKGIPEWNVIWNHAFRNVLVQLITIIGLTYASLLEGSVLTETVFSWPGIGLYITNSLFNNDMNAVLGGTIVVGVCFVGINGAAMAGEWEIFDNALAHLILPASILGTFALAYISRMTRSFMLDQLSQEYILTARVKGIPG